MGNNSQEEESRLHNVVAVSPLFSHEPGEVDPTFASYQDEGWKVCFPENFETNKKNLKVWYLCDDQKKEVHRLVAEQSFMSTFGMYLDGTLLLAIEIDWKWRGNPKIIYIDESHSVKIECEISKMGSMTVAFTLGGRAYEIVRHGYLSDIFVPTFFRRLRLYVDGKDPSSGWNPRVPPLSGTKLQAVSLGFIFGIYFMMLLVPILKIPGLLWLAYILNQYRHSFSAKKEITQITLQNAICDQLQYNNDIHKNEEQQYTTEILQASLENNNSENINIDR